MKPALLIPIFFLLFAIPARAEVTREQIKEVGKELACLCGDCPRRPLDECICGYAQQQHERIKKMLASGQTPQAIVDAYIREFGLEILSKPPAQRLQPHGMAYAAPRSPHRVLRRTQRASRLVKNKKSRHTSRTTRAR